MYTQWALTILLGCRLTSAVEFLGRAAPLVTANLAARQATCGATTDTVCPDGNGCCPSGAPCAYDTGRPICRTPCNGSPCPGGGCCDLGYSCPTAVDGLCTQTGGFHVPTLSVPPLSPPPISSYNPGGPIMTSSYNPGGPIMTSEPSLPAPGSTYSNTPSQSSSSPAMTSTQVSSTAPIVGSSSAGTALPTPAPGVASSLSLGLDSWMAWAFAWAIGLPFIA